MKFELIGIYYYTKARGDCVSRNLPPHIFVDKTRLTRLGVPLRSTRPFWVPFECSTGSLPATDSETCGNELGGWAVFKILASVVVPMQSICVGTTIILWACFWLIRYKVPYPSVPYRYCMHPSRCRIGTGTVPIPDFSDNYLGDNYLNCIYNCRYRNLSKLLFLHPSCNGSPPFVILYTICFPPVMFSAA